MERKFSEFSKFMESDKSLKRKFKDPVCWHSLAGAVVASLSVTQEALCSNNIL